MCCCSSTKVREGAVLAPSREKVIRAALLSNNPESPLKKIISISLETFRDTSFFYTTNTAIFDHILSPPNEEEFNILFIEDREGSQETLSLVADKMQDEETELLKQIPIIYVSKEPSHQSFIMHRISPPKEIILGFVVHISKIFSEHFPLSERQKPTTRFYPVL